MKHSVSGSSWMVFTLAALPFALILGPATSRLVEAHDGVGENVGFVQAQGGVFVAATGQPPFRFVGTNAYFLLDAYASSNFPQHTIGTLCLATGIQLENTKDIDGQSLVFPCAKGGVSYIDRGLGMPVLRTWGFRDGPPHTTPGACSLQPAPGLYDQDCFPKLDWVLHQADRAGVRLIVTLVNNWKEYGGIPQYLKWCSPANPNDKRQFYTNEACKKLYKDYVKYVLNRPNSFGPVTETPSVDNPQGRRRYKDDPTVFAWELMNEPRCAECVAADGGDKGASVRQWLDEMSGFIKSQDPNHMVATGEEGFDCTKVASGVTKAPGYTDVTSIRRKPWMYDGSQGVCYTANTRLPNIDFASAHLWPHHWIIDPETSGTTWVADHLRIAKGYIYEPDSGTAPRDPTLNKPFVLGEFGSDKMHQRASYFDKWLDAVENTSNLAGSTVRGDGALVWQVVCDYDLASCRNYAFRLEILYPPASSVSNTLLCHAQIARGTQPDVPC